MRPDVVLEGVGGGEAQAGKWAVEGGEIEPVGEVGDRGGHELGERRVAPRRGREGRVEVRPREGGALRVGVEELVVVAPQDVLAEERPEVGAEVDAVVVGHDGGDGRVVEEAGQAGPWCLEPVADLRAVGDAPAGAGQQHGLAPEGSYRNAPSPSSTKRPPRPSVSSTITSTKARPRPRTITGSPGSNASRSMSAV